MYNYNFECEKIILEIVDNLVSVNDKVLKVNILVTEENLLLFRNVKEGSVLAGREIHEMPEYELVLKIKFSDIDYEIDDKHTIIKKDNNEIILYNFDLTKVKISIFNDKNVIY